MHFSTSVTYPAAAPRVVQLWRQEAFHRAKAERAGAKRVEVTMSGERDLTVTIRADIPSNLLPSAARRFVGDALHVTIVEAWGPAADSERSGTLAIDIAGAPVSVRAQMGLLPVSATSCTRTIDGEVLSLIHI